jgi:hypothetical protein
MTLTLFDLLLEKLLGLVVLSDGASSHIEYLVVSVVDLVIEKADALVDVIGLELPHDVGTGDRPVNVRDYYLLILLPEEYLELRLLYYSWGDFEHKLGLILTHT